ncbi:RDD family protein [Zhouia sp. PK063]|uniref:RDD family protein n=1 Tax=Zhouia sp. PK063 TaxID=3373602 RepID=UPI003796B46D
MLSIEILEHIANRNPRYHRISAMALDHIIMSFVLLPISIPLVMILDHSNFQLYDRGITYVWIFVLFIYYNKDFFNAKSPAKKIMGYQVVDKKTHKQATELQCFVRNLTILIWPVEVLIGFYNPERRLGDFLANTKVVSREKEPLKTIWSDIKSTTLKKNYIGIISIGIVYFYGFSYLLP